MQNRHNGRRRRGGNNNPRPMGQPMGGQGNNNRLEVRVRGNAHQLLEKYKLLARDAHQAGDRVATEYYLQHADHYFRVLNDTRIRQDEMRARRGLFDQLDEEVDEEHNDNSAMDGNDSEAGQEVRPDRRSEERPVARVSRGDRGERAERGERPERSERAERGERRVRESAPAGAAVREERSPRGEVAEDEAVRPRRWRQERPAAEPAGEAVSLSDGEAALLAFGGAPTRETTAEAAAPAPTPEIMSEAAPAPQAEAAVEVEAPKRRRGRPRKTEVVVVEE